MKTPFLLYEFSDEKGQIKPIVFTEPEFVLQTNRLDGVQAIFQQVDRSVRDGYYAAGFVSYEAAPAFDSNMAAHTNTKLPLVWFGIFSHFSAYEPDFFPEQPFQVSDWKMNTTIGDYEKNIEWIKHAIEEGDTYQVNYTERLSATWKGDAFSFYRQLARNQQSNYSAYLNVGDFQILSASPELFFSVNKNKIKTKPMKGTAARGRTKIEDEVILKKLLASEKEKAENLMIVDLLRNDISRIAAPASVKVTSLFEPETYPTVHQLTSTIEADLKPDSSLLDWFKALFPCGSITGAPKISTMDYISRLETSPREVYCGAIGYITPERNAAFNVPIRTVILDSKNSTASYGVGGGITWDSTAKGEYDELFSKAKLLTERRPAFQLIESLKLENGTYPLLAYHLQRLQDSAAYFNFKLDSDTIRQSLIRYSEIYRAGSYKVRLLVAESGQYQIETAPVAEHLPVVSVTLADFPLDSHNPFLYHKTTNRKIYDQFEKEKPDGIFSVLLWNEQEELTEFTIGNLVVEKNGRFFTPPVSSGLLPGTYRQYLLDESKIEEKVILKDELAQADSIWFINSVRGWLRAKMC